MKTPKILTDYKRDRMIPESDTQAIQEWNHYINFLHKHKDTFMVTWFTIQTADGSIIDLFDAQMHNEWNMLKNK